MTVYFSLEDMAPISTVSDDQMSVKILQVLDVKKCSTRAYEYNNYFCNIGRNDRTLIIIRSTSRIISPSKIRLNYLNDMSMKWFRYLGFLSEVQG